VGGGWEGGEGVWGCGTFTQHSAPLVVALLDWVRHVFVRARAEEGAEEGDGGHGFQEGGARERLEGSYALRRSGEGVVG